MEKIIAQIKKSSHLLITSHAEPDGDAVGSLIALGLAIGKLNLKTTLYNESPIPAVYRFPGNISPGTPFIFSVWSSLTDICVNHNYSL